MIQWLRLSALSAGALGLIPSWGTEILQAVQLGKPHPSIKTLHAKTKESKASIPNVPGAEMGSSDAFLNETSHITKYSNTTTVIGHPLPCPTTMRNIAKERIAVSRIRFPRCDMTNDKTFFLILWLTPNS